MIQPMIVLSTALRLGSVMFQRGQRVVMHAATRSPSSPESESEPNLFMGDEIKRATLAQPTKSGPVDYPYYTYEMCLRLLLEPVEILDVRIRRQFRGSGFLPRSLFTSCVHRRDSRMAKPPHGAEDGDGSNGTRAGPRGWSSSPSPASFYLQGANQSRLAEIKRATLQFQSSTRLVSTRSV